MKHLFTQRLTLFLLSFLLFTYSCRKDDVTEGAGASLKYKTADYDTKVATEWYGLTLDLIKTTGGYSPPVASRALGYIGIAFYESVVNGMPNNKSIASQLNGLDITDMPKIDASKSYYWPLAANASFKTIIKKFFPTASAEKLAEIDKLAASLEQVLQLQVTGSDAAEIISNSKAYGEDVANAIFDWSATDAIGHEGYKKNFPADYNYTKTTGAWVPTGANKIPLQPYWGYARTFIARCAILTQPDAPYTFSTDKFSNFYAEAMEVYATSKAITEEQKAIAWYWADGGGTVTPPGHSIAILLQIAQEKGIKLDKMAEASAMLGIAVSDAFMSCWRCKYIYSVMRPESYIQQNIDNTWKPLFPTPPFPEYTSGHSTQSGAMAVIMTKIFGSIEFTDKTHETTKVVGVPDAYFAPRTFSNFVDAAKEAMNSRLYGGIHYRRANEKGFDQGVKVGNMVLDNIHFSK